MVSEAYLWEDLAAWALVVSTACLAFVACSYAAMHEWRGWRRARAGPPRAEASGDVGARR